MLYQPLSNSYCQNYKLVFIFQKQFRSEHFQQELDDCSDRGDVGPKDFDAADDEWERRSKIVDTIFVRNPQAHSPSGPWSTQTARKSLQTGHDGKIYLSPNPGFLTTVLDSVTFVCKNTTIYMFVYGSVIHCNIKYMKSRKFQIIWLVVNSKIAYVENSRILNWSYN